jgi:hypothetical protein
MTLPHLKIFDFPNFWTNFYYIKDYLFLSLLLGVMSTFLVTEFQKMLSSALILFTLERLGFNIFMTFISIEYQDKIRNSGPIGIILSIELFVALYLSRHYIRRLIKLK